MVSGAFCLMLAGRQSFYARRGRGAYRHGTAEPALGAAGVLLSGPGPAKIMNGPAFRRRSRPFWRRASLCGRRGLRRPGAWAAGDGAELPERALSLGVGVGVGGAADQGTLLGHIVQRGMLGMLGHLKGCTWLEHRPACPKAAAAQNMNKTKSVIFMGVLSYSTGDGAPSMPT